VTSDCCHHSRVTIGHHVTICTTCHHTSQPVTTCDHLRNCHCHQCGCMLPPATTYHRLHHLPPVNSYVTVCHRLSPSVTTSPSAQPVATCDHLRYYNCHHLRPRVTACYHVTACHRPVPPPTACHDRSPHVTACHRPLPHMLPHVTACHRRYHTCWHMSPPVTAGTTYHRLSPSVATCYRLSPPAATHVATWHRLSPPGATYHRLSPSVVTGPLPHMLPHVTACHHLPPHPSSPATTSRNLCHRMLSPTCHFHPFHHLSPSAPPQLLPQKKFESIADSLSVCEIVMESSTSAKIQ
jgi:hypothetical protein